MIIGGTSGIGLALANRHFKLGWHVVVVGKSRDKIQRLNNEQPHILTFQCDITDINERRQLFEQLERHNFKRFIYCAGWYLNERVFSLNQQDSARMLAVNLQAFQAVFDWASEQLKINNHHGKADLNANDHNPALVCLSSIAGIMSYPYASLYAKCKRAMIATASAYRLGLKPFNINVNCIALGYVDTQTLRDLNHGDASHKPFIMTQAKAVEHIMKAITDNVELAVFPKLMLYLTQALDKAPKRVLYWIIRRKLDKTPHHTNQ
ncbi:SDR family NAD(P)-dependent oxidoreductase [uncultured Psychrobacter sp.]|uniref:SDR family NAD(P)-dependent oxidoreductase n=1 Tax=uncultured Psychrobacter sp. TaxID=259303 RepID=UPI003458AC6A